MPFCLNAYNRVTLDLTELLLPFSTCVLVCVTLGFTPPTQSILMQRTYRIALIHENQESELLELQITLPSSGQLHESLKSQCKQMRLISCHIHSIFFSHLSCSAHLRVLDTEIQTCARRAVKVTDLCLESPLNFLSQVSCDTYKDSKIKLILII